MNVDANAPPDMRTLQEAAVKVLKEYRFDRDVVIKIIEVMENASVGNLVCTN